MDTRKAEGEGENVVWNEAHPWDTFLYSGWAGELDPASHYPEDMPDFSPEPTQLGKGQSLSGHGERACACSYCSVRAGSNLGIPRLYNFWLGLYQFFCTSVFQSVL